VTEEEARAWVRERFGVPRETLLERFAAIVLAESDRQNLISAATRAEMWARHLTDSAQLVPLADAFDGTWVDVGTGAGFPGMVVALLTDREVQLIEPRAKRAAFLRSAAEALGVANRVYVSAQRAQSVPRAIAAAVISARAVTSLGELFTAARHLSTRSTLWLLPKGRNAQSEVEDVTRAWQGVFHVEQSLTQAESAIVIAREVRPL
jgi:16S rRNA (guanine527-N7)-methyltransferase